MYVVNSSMSEQRHSKFKKLSTHCGVCLCKKNKLAKLMFLTQRFLERWCNPVYVKTISRCLSQV